MTSSAASTSSTPAAMTTFSYRLDGRVTIDDDVNWPYSTALRNGDPAEIARYEARFCSEVRDALLWRGTRRASVARYETRFYEEVRDALLERGMRRASVARYEWRFCCYKYRCIYSFVRTAEMSICLVLVELSLAFWCLHQHPLHDPRLQVSHPCYNFTLSLFQ